MQPLDKLLGAIQRVRVNPKMIRKWRREYTFLKLSTDLTREAAQYTCVLGGAFVGNRDYWTRDEAVLGGHLVRLFKLLRHAIEQARDKQPEMLWVAVRVAVECAVNFRFLLANRAGAAFDSYVHYSLQHERDLLLEIKKSAGARGGKVLPIEARMLRSIAKAFKNSGVEPQDLPERRIRNWANKSVFDRAKAIGLGEAYAGVFGGPSSSIHGNWGDLRQNHLEAIAPLRFRPKFDSPPVRPHPFFMLTRIIVPGLMEYTAGLNVVEGRALEDRLADLLERTELADALHEEFLVKTRTGGSGSAVE